MGTKKFVSILLTLAICFGMLPTVTLANGSGTRMVDAVAQIGDTPYSTLAEAIGEVEDGQAVTLLQDAPLTSVLTIDSGKRITLQLNDRAIEAGEHYIMLTHGSLELVGPGAVNSTNGNYAFKVVGAADDVADHSVLTIGEGVTVSSKGYGAMISPRASTGPVQYYGTKIVIHGTVNSTYGIYVNGQLNKTTGNVPRFVVGPKANIDGGGIYAAGYAIWDLAGNVTGGHALSLKSGNFTINGGTYHATGEYADPAAASSNGSEDTGAALSLTSNDSYAKELTVTVNGGEFISDKGHAVYEGIAKDPNGKPVAASSFVRLDIRGGTFTSGQGKEAVKITEAAETKVVTGGTFSTDPSAYVDDAHIVVLDSSAYVVKVLDATTAAAMIGADCYRTLPDAVAAATDNQTVTLNQNVILTDTITLDKSLTIDLNGRTITGDDKRVFHLTGGDVTITGSGILTSVKGETFVDSSSVIRLGDNNGEMRPVKLTIGEQVEVKSDTSYGITVFGSKTTETLVVKGKITTKNAPAISGNGVAAYGGTAITVDEGAVLSTSAENALYIPQSGTLTIKGTVTGLGGMEVKAGATDIQSTAVITATGTPGHTANSNGCSTQGYAIAVADNPAYAGEAKVNIAGGRISGAVGIADDDGDGENNTGAIVITGGYFTHDPGAFVVDGFEAVKSGQWYLVNQAVEHEHAWVEATCVAPKTCRVCGLSEGVALEHAWVDATCTAPKTCQTCGVTEGTVTGHTMTPAVTQPTCTERGYTTHTCSVCDASYVDAFTDATGHTWDEGVVTIPATADKDGVRTYTCTVCAVKQSVTIPAEGHSFTSEEIVPTCITQGYTLHTCTTCGEDGKVHTYYDTLTPATGHQHTPDTVLPTCTTRGYTTHTCPVCGDRYVDSYVNATGHQWDVGVVTKEPTSEEGGVKTFTCTACSVTRTEEIPAIGHIFVPVVTAPTCTTQGYTTFTCATCRDTEHAHSYQANPTPATGHTMTSTVTPPSCTERGYTTLTCTTCGYKTVGSFVEPAGHSYAVKSTKAATTRADGYTEYACGVCGHTYRVAIPMVGHVFTAAVTPPSCTEQGYTTYTCTTCGEENGKAKHTYEGSYVPVTGHHWQAGTPVVEASCQHGGYTTYICANGCGDTKIGNQTAMAAHSFENGSCTVCGAADLAKRAGDLIQVETVLTETEFNALPAELKESFADQAALQETMLRQSRQVAPDLLQNNSKLVDVRLKLAGEEKYVSANNFPEDGYELVIGYPANTDKDMEFVVSHMLSSTYNGNIAGYMEFLPYTAEDDGLHVRVQALSPILVTWGIPEPPTPRPPIGGSSTTTQPVVIPPIENAANAPKVEATIKDGVATVRDVSASEIAKAGKKAVSMDFSVLGKDVDEVKLPTSTVRAIAKSDASGLEIKLSTATVALNADAVASIADAATGKDVTLRVETVDKGKLSAGQKSAVERLGGGVVIKVTLTSNGEAISSFDGSATVRVPCEKKDADNEVLVYLLDNDGKLTRLDASYNTAAKSVAFTTSRLSQFVLTEVEPLPFTDVDERAFYYDAVVWAYRKGMTVGVSDTRYGPDIPCDRGQIVTFLWRAAGSPEPTIKTGPFTDVDVNSFYGKAVLWAVEEEITKGTSDTTFSPTDACSRAQAVTFLYRTVGSPTVKNAAPFTDVAGDAYYADAVRWAVEAGVTNGTGDNRFSPDAVCTRGQIVTLLYRWMVK